jgi:hypothetical protein
VTRLVPAAWAGPGCATTGHESLRARPSRAAPPQRDLRPRHQHSKLTGYGQTTLASRRRSTGQCGPGGRRAALRRCRNPSGPRSGFEEPRAPLASRVARSPVDSGRRSWPGPARSGTRADRHARPRPRRAKLERAAPGHRASRRPHRPRPAGQEHCASPAVAGRAPIAALGGARSTAAAGQGGPEARATVRARSRARVACAR